MYKYEIHTKSGMSIVKNNKASYNTCITKNEKREHMKKLLVAFICGAFVFMTTLAPTKALDESINAQEQRLLDYVEKGIEVDGQVISWKVGSEEYNNLKTILASQQVNLSEENVNTIKDSAKNILAYAKSLPADTQMTHVILTHVLSLASPALDIFGLKAYYNAAKDILTIMSADGDEIYKLENVLKEATQIKDQMTKPTQGTKLERTGENFTSTYTIIGSLMVVLAGAGLFVLKKKEFIEC